MAERRMFAKAIIGSGRFLRMPVSARLLYYDLGMEADDDGFVEAFRVMRTTGATEDDLRILCAKGFVRVLNEELVTLICDWKVNNTIKNDRYHKSVYADLAESPDIQWIQSGTNMDPNRIQNGSNMEPQVRLGKESIGKVSIDKSIEGASDDAPTTTKRKKNPPFRPPTVDEVRAYCAENGYDIDAEYFVDYYEQNGWMVGRNKMKSWQATVRNWARRDKERGTVSGGYAQKPKRDPMLEFLDNELKKELAKDDESGNSSNLEGIASILPGFLH